jgi:hypothetical protein
MSSPWLAAFMQDYASASASNVNATAQNQSNPTEVSGKDLGPINVENSQTNMTGQTADADASDLGGFGHGGFGHGFGGGADADASNFNLTLQNQVNPTVIIGEHTGPINVENSKTNGTFQTADADASDFGHFGFGHFGIAL